MRWGMGLSKNRHGTYYAVKKVPAHLQEAVADVLDNGKPRQVCSSAPSAPRIGVKPTDEKGSSDRI